ncbi:MAG: DNA alkylation repair protein [Myxococcales bacterium]|nr:DNA alkylation repair protein [Myxococcales bacterium]
MDTAAFVDEIIARLEAAHSPARREHAEGYTPTAMRHIGVTVPDMRAVVRDVSKRIKGEPADAVLALAQALIAAGTFEGQLAAFEIVARHAPAVATLDATTLEALGSGIDNWASVDTFATNLSGQAWREGRISDARVARWARSRDRWWRRTALVSTIPLNMRSRGGKGDPARALAICEMLAEDHDDMVVKALSWALREVLPHDRDAVERFIAEHEQTLAKRVLREVRTKLEHGKKNVKKRGS